jgi:hypothetical protein
MQQLLGPNGTPISSKNFKKADAPRSLGEGPGQWAGRDVEFFTLPGGATVQFNLNNLTLSDYRSMRDHYQVNASQSVLAFMIHQADWSIECEDKKIADHCTANMTEIWTRLVRAVSQSYWAGFSPNALEWTNDMNNRTLQLTKIKDLVPEECKVNWKTLEVDVPDVPIETVTGAGTPIRRNDTTAKVRIYNGIVQQGWPRPIPVENTFWYPLLMENGNFYGRKLLRSAFTPWFFSILIHLFSNRYFERFGEPVPVGRAPYEDEVNVNGVQTKGNVLMETVLTQLRNRSVVVLPNDRTTFGDTSTSYPDYDIQYLESQMRGADFERYLTRLDEEISLSQFTPLLILRTSDVGSYNLGITHMQVYLWMLNALLGDKKEYIDRYILSPMVNYNFSEKAPRAKIKFRKLGKESAEMVRAVMTELVRGGKAAPDLEELGQMSGLTLKEIQQVTEPPVDDPTQDKRGPRQKAKMPKGADKSRSTGKEISARISGQVVKAFREGTFGVSFIPRMGYRRQMEEALRDDHGTRAIALVNDMYRRMDAWLADVLALGKEDYRTPEEFMGLFDRMLESELEVIDDQG